MHNLDATPEVVLNHDAEKHEVQNQQKQVRSHKYVLSPSKKLGLDKSSQSHDNRSSSIAWILNLLLCHRHSKWKSRHHHKEKHSLAGKTDKTHAVSVSLE